MKASLIILAKNRVLQYEDEDDVYKAIIGSSMRPNKEVNKKFGLE